VDGVVGVDVVPVGGVLEGDGAAERAGLGQVVAARGAAGGGRGGAVLVGGRGDLHWVGCWLLLCSKASS